MSLRVWLPLTGNLNNQGLDNVTVTNSGATVNAAGKIGSCYSFNGSSARISCSAMTVTYPISICGWFNCSSYNSTTQYWFSYNTDTGGTVGHAIGFGMYESMFCVWYGGVVVKLQSITTNTWYHITVTISKSKQCKTYINGELIDTRTFTATPPASKWITIGARSNSTTGGVGAAAYYFTGQANDVRFYDHCLSPKEVKEIAQGLVVHYPLDTDSHPNENLLPEANRRMTENGTTSSNEYMNLCSILSIVDTYGLVPYTISFDIKSAVNGTFQLYGSYSSNPKYSWTPLYNIKTTPEWKRVTYTFTPRLNNSSGTWAGCSVYGTYGSGAIVSIRKVKFELGTVATPMIGEGGDKIYDCSGYGNDGTITGSMVANNTTPRYDSSIKFPDSACSIGIGNLTTLIPGGVFTFNIWFKKDTGEWASKSWETILGGPSGFELEGKLSGTQNAYVHPYSWGGGSTTTPNSYSIAYELNTWNMLTMVRNETGTKFYLNGEWKVNGSGRGSFPSGDYFIGA